MQCATLNKLRGVQNERIRICTDSQAAIMALSSHKVTSRLVWECIKTLNELAEHNKITLMWVPGHCGVEGNEKADELAKQGSMNMAGAMGGQTNFAGMIANGQGIAPVTAGAKAEISDEWTCPTCKTVNKGKFCPECGTKKPSGVISYRCNKCGWEPADSTNPPKFCPECGDPFTDADIVK